ncbi:glutamyl-tRNA synthetase [Aaosphaeria arxii CBS 175.79]|uniref:Glutamate--tRNA ligase, mitochondrial n=1 Tax=Aaosphaeria arxii CBS 175.79 TaxID=1450172 RepID=A0A6A5XNY3_9PLEO|nr:glutamyl-tRNA synthetase [Aaosphaeria arxii CBS 175.79]KAF2014852.1 glutamyl-tRNA synthetase [Aaosphaeria arxii CBS 175.79]
MPATPLSLAWPSFRPYTCTSCLLRLSRVSRRSHASSAPIIGSRPKKSKASLPDVPARTRFAPSPTGFLHLGSLRTALFNYLLARRTGGQFLLRIEDTDQKRTVPGAEARLLEDLRWAGLEWDEGPEVGGPHGSYRQSERSSLYRTHAHDLLQSGHAYRCFCTPERLRTLAEHRHGLGLATDYDRTCANIPREESDDRAHRGEKHVIRLLASTTYPAYQDIVYGAFKPLKPRLQGDNSFEDPILLKSDGLPTYHLANVVDDHHMQITHVIRGSEWMPSTPKHIAMYDAFGWAPPQFAHVGLLVDEHGNKLSKRNFDTDIQAFKDMEIFPETLTNFAALLGWSHQGRSDVMDLNKLVEKFTLKFTKGNTTVTFGKLQFLQRKHAAVRALAGGEGRQDMVQNVLSLLQDPEGPYQDWQSHISGSPSTFVEQIIQSDGENYTNANEFVHRNSFMFKRLRQTPNSIHDKDIAFRVKALGDTKSWSREELMQKVREIIDDRPEGRKGSKDVYHYLRSALTDREDGMRIYDVMMILGRKETLARLGIEES